MKYKSVLVVTYEQSGSILLQGLLNSLEGVTIRGENNDFCWGLYLAWKSLVISKSNRGGEQSYSSTNPWYGAGELSPEGFLEQAASLIKEQLIPSDDGACNCYGFKEIRYINHLRELPSYLYFLQKVFPESAIIFNTRAHHEVYKSCVLAQEDTTGLDQKIKIADQIFFNYAMEHSSTFIMRYEQLIRGVDGVRPLMEFLGCEFDVELIEQVLQAPHSYEHQESEHNEVNKVEGQNKAAKSVTTFSLPKGLLFDERSNVNEFTLDGVLVVAVVKDEMLRLPWFFEYYRKMGACGFLFIDDGSTDGTIEYLLSQEDVMLYHSGSERYSTSQFGRDWMNALISKYAKHRWVLCVDADELLCWPGYRIEGLSGLVSRAERLGLKEIFTPMIDAYSDQPSSEIELYKPGTPFGDVCAWIDPVNTMVARWSVDGRLFLYSGPRLRFHNDPNSRPPLMSKQTLFYVEDGGAFHANPHFTTKGKPSPLVAPLLHYKYLSDFSDRIEKAIDEGEHWRDAKEYKNYKKQSLASKKMKMDTSINIHTGMDLEGHIKVINRMIFNGVPVS